MALKETYIDLTKDCNEEIITKIDLILFSHGCKWYYGSRCTFTNLYVFIDKELIIRTTDSIKNLIRPYDTFKKIEINTILNM